MMGANVEVIEERVLFSPDMTPEVNAMLQSAVANADDFDRARELLYEAKAMAPQQLEVYIALYKFLFYRGFCDEAEIIAREALSQAAMQGRFDSDWRVLDSNSSNWSVEDGPQRVYLYSLKALAFIRLRKGRSDEAKAILAKLSQLDPLDQVGGSVIMEMAAAL